MWRETDGYPFNAAIGPALPELKVRRTDAAKFDGPATARTMVQRLNQSSKVGVNPHTIDGDGSRGRFNLVDEQAI